MNSSARRAVAAALDRRRPRDGGLDGVAGAPDVEVRDQPQARRVLDRLVRRAVLAEADRVVRVDEDRAQLHQRRHAQRVARVVGERQERADVGNEAAVQREAVGDRAHAELAHAEVDVVARRASRVDRHAARPVGEHRAGEVGRAADHLRQRRARAPRSPAATPCAWRWSRPWPPARRRTRRPSPAKSAGSSPAMRRANSAASSGMRGAVGGEARRPRAPRAARRAARASHAGVDRRRDLERRVGPAERGARRRDFLLAERRAVRVGGAGLGRRALADHRLAADQRRPVGVAPARRAIARVDRVDVVAVDVRGSRASRRPRSAPACRR